MNLKGTLSDVKMIWMKNFKMKITNEILLATLLRVLSNERSISNLDVEFYDCIGPRSVIYYIMKYKLGYIYPRCVKQ